MIRRGIHASVVIDVEGKLVLPKTTIIEPGCVLYGGPAAELRFGEQNTIYPGCTFRVDRGFIVTGSRVSFGPNCAIYEPRAGLTIGDDTLIAGGVMICGVQHGFERTDMPMRDQPTRELPVTIGSDVWIGMGAILLPGAEIGDGCVIGAGSVVTGRVPPRTIGKGVPFRGERER
jgi:acetyltransferase-like isoleucine patch superfamily enzyme